MTSVDMPRPLLGHEMLTLQSFSWQQRKEQLEQWKEHVQKVTAHKHMDGLLADLAGNAVCGSVMLAVMSAAFCFLFLG